MSRHALARITIPEGLRYADLRLSRDPTTGAVEYSLDAVRRVAEASGLDLDVLVTEDAITSLLVQWYRAARAGGEPQDPVQEDLLREIEAEDQRGGGLSHQPGRA